MGPARDGECRSAEPQCSPGSPTRAIKKLKNDLIDFQVRDIVTKETKNVRDLLIAKAFATTDKYETNPPGEVSDPVGFKP